MFINRGRIVLSCSMEEYESRYQEVMVHPEQIGAARALKRCTSVRRLGAISFSLTVSITSNWPRWATRAHQHCRLIIAVVAITPERHKEQQDEYSIERHAECSSRSAGCHDAVVAATRPLYWSIRRELWENRSLYIAPLTIASLFLVGFLISTIQTDAEMRAT